MKNFIEIEIADIATDGGYIDRNTGTDIGINDANALKEEIRRNASNPGRIGSWKPLNYDLDPVRYSITSYKSLSKATSTY